MTSVGCSAVTLTAVQPIPLIKTGDDLGALILVALRAMQVELQHGDVVVVAQKIVSKAEGRTRALADVVVSKTASDLAREVDKDPRLVQLILDESTEVVRQRHGVLIVNHKSGVVMANAGIDRSNVDDDPDSQKVLLLPVDCDASAGIFRDQLEQASGCRIGVIVCDSVGRAWRNGTTGLALGVSGLDSLLDLRGDRDLFGRKLQVSMVGHADQIASAAQLVMGEGDEGLPVVLVRGLKAPDGSGSAGDLVRPANQDLFR